MNLLSFKYNAIIQIRVIQICNININNPYPPHQSQMKSCFFYLKQSDNMPNPEQIRKSLTESPVQQKIKTLKQFIKCLVNDDTYPPMIMVIITNIIPLLAKHPELRKPLLLYWQVIQKSKSPNDPALKDQMFLACNSLRSDLLSHNEFLRGRTLRLVSRIMHKGVIQPLSSAITDNINHKSAYVRRNTVVCLYNVFMNFGSDIIGDIDEEIEQLLKTQTDLSTKRNAFILLSKSNSAKAMEYLQQQINSESLQDLGDILQLAILKVLKQKAKQQPQNRAKFLKIINAFTFKASQSVLLECSITSLAVSNSVMSIKAALSSYVNILSRTNQLNVKKIVLDKLETACKNSNYIEEALVQDLIKNIKTPSNQIKIKILNIVSMNLNPKIAQSLFNEIKREINECNDKDYLYKIIKTLEHMALKFSNLHKSLLSFILTKIFKLQTQKLSAQCAESLSRTIKLILERASKQQQSTYKKEIVQNFKTINSKQCIKQVLNIYGNNFNKIQDIEIAIDGIRSAIGSLPIQMSGANKELDEEENQTKAKVHFKTRVLEDGTYRTQMIQQKQQGDQKIEETYFRKVLAQDSIIGGVFARNIGKMLYKIRASAQFNKNACSILMILCSLLRNYEEHIYQVDQTTIDQISTLIRKIVTPDQFIKGTDKSFEAKKENVQELINQNLNQKESNILEKNPSDLIFFRQLKKGGQQQFDDQQVNQIMAQKREKQNFVDKLKSMVQLTGHFDPLYAQSFITVSKTDIFFQLLIINTTKSNMLNIQIQFASTAQIMVLEKAQSVNLRPFESASLRTQIRFTTGQFGSIYGYINYDNQAGIQQPYLITEQIKIDFIRFIVPAKIHDNQFKIKWSEYQQNQLKHETTIKQQNPQKQQMQQPQQSLSFEQIYKIIEQQIHVLRVGDSTSTSTSASTSMHQQQQQYFVSKSFYGKSKLGQDFLIIVTIFKDNDIDVSFNVRSKEPAIGNMIIKKIKEINIGQLAQLADDQADGETTK